jgi:hypothetical protein
MSAEPRRHTRNCKSRENLPDLRRLRKTQASKMRIAWFSKKNGFGILAFRPVLRWLPPLHPCTHIHV